MVPDNGALLKGVQTIQLDMFHSSYIDSAVVPWKGSKYTFIPVYEGQDLTSVKPTEAMVKSTGFSSETLSKSLEFNFLMNIATTRYEERRIMVTDLIVVMTNTVGSLLGVYIIFTMFHLIIRRQMIRRAALIRERNEKPSEGYQTALKTIPAWKKSLMKNRNMSVKVENQHASLTPLSPAGSPVDTKGVGPFNKVVTREKRMHQNHSLPSDSGVTSS